MKNNRAAYYDARARRGEGKSCDNDPLRLGDLATATTFGLRQCPRETVGRVNLTVRAFFDHAAQNLALPLSLMHRPALHRPAAVDDEARLALLVDQALAFLLGRREHAPRRPGVAA